MILGKRKKHESGARALDEVGLLSIVFPPYIVKSAQ